MLTVWSFFYGFGSGRLLGLSWDLLGPSCGSLGGPWRLLGGLLGLAWATGAPLGASWGVLGTLLGLLGGSWRLLGSLLGLAWPIMWASWGIGVGGAFRCGAGSCRPVTLLGVLGWGWEIGVGGAFRCGAGLVGRLHSSYLCVCIDIYFSLDICYCLLCSKATQAAP